MAHDAWEASNLGSVLNVLHRYPSYYGIEYQADGVAEIRGELIRGDGELAGPDGDYRFIAEHTARRFPKTSVVEGDFVMSVRGTIGKIGRVPNWLTGGNITANLIRMSPNPEKVVSPFLGQVLRSRGFQTLLQQASSTTTIKTIKVPELRALPLMLPPLPEQRKIAAILTAVDETIEKTTAVIEQLGVVKKAMMQELLTRGLPGRHTRFKQTEIGQIPEEWELAELADVVKDGTIVTYGIVQAGPEVPGGVPYVRTGDVKPTGIAIESLRHTSREIASKFRRSEVEAGDLVYCIRASVGAVAKVPRELHGANLTQGTARIAPGKQTAGDFLLWALRSPPLASWVDQQCKGSTFREITLKRLRQTPIPLPREDEQLEIAATLNGLFERELTERDVLDNLGRTKAALMSVLLTGELRVAPDETAA